MGILLLSKEHEHLSYAGVPHLFVDMIFANNAQYCDKVKDAPHRGLHEWIRVY